MDENWKPIVCAIVWVISLPIRVIFTAVFGTFALLASPLCLLMDAHQWACKNEKFGDTWWRFPKYIWWDFLIMGRFDL